MNRQDLKHLLGDVARALPHAGPWSLDTWGPSRSPDGGMMRGGVELDALLERYGSPLYVLDEARLEANVARFLATPPGASAGCEIYYSYKTNPVPQVLRRMHALGVGAEAASPYELWLALELGVTPSSIIYDAPAKTPESLVVAIDQQIGLINLNGREEIALVADLARARRRQARVGIRVVAPGGRAGQFGMRIDTGEALAAFREAMARPELQVVGLHSHVNGTLATKEQVGAYVGALLEFTEQLRRELGLVLEIIDVGGNLGCRTAQRLTSDAKQWSVTLGVPPSPPDLDAVLSIDAYVAQVVGLVEAHAAEHGVPRPRIFMEPGRAMTSDTMMVLCRVLSLHGEDPAGLRWAVLDAGINVAEPVPNEFHQLFALRPRGGDEHVYRLTGPSCMLADQLYPAWRLPPLHAGDALAIMDAGAYFVPLSTCFSQPRPGVVSVKDGRVEVLRRPETFEDLVLRDGLRNEPLHAVVTELPAAAND